MTEERKKMVLDFADPRSLIPETVKPLFDCWIRDTHITLAEDGYYYCTGTTRADGEDACWLFNDGIQLWRSPDLENWEDLGLVWTFEKDGTWQNKWYAPMGGFNDVHPYGPDSHRALYAPEIYQIKGDFYITASINWPKQKEGEKRCCTFLLKSNTGKAEGPYGDYHGGPMTTLIDSSLFVDDDGSVYYLWQDGYISKMKDDMTGFAEEPHHLVRTEYDPEPYSEGVFMFKHEGVYNFCLAKWTTEKNQKAGYFLMDREKKLSYDCIITTSKYVYGPYSNRYTSITGGGHNSFFTGKDGKFYATMFGNPVNDSFAPFYAKPAIIEMEWNKGNLFPKR